MAMGKWIAGASVAAAGMAGWQFRSRYNRWQQQQVKRLATNSQLAHTVRGPIEYALEGQGPIILVLHGTPGGYDTALLSAHWLGLEEYTILAPSRPGYLRTPLSNGESPAQAADLCAALLDTLAIGQVVVLAISGGGPTGLEFALRHPERCNGLILVSALTQRSSRAERYRSQPPRERISAYATDALLASNPLIYILHNLISFGPEESQEAAKKTIEGLAMPNLRKEGNENDEHEFAQLPGFPVQDILAPTLILHATEDYEIPIAQLEKLAQQIPHAQFQAFEGDHIFFSTPKHKAALKTTLETFLQQKVGR